jgi:hypothetical protein
MATGALGGLSLALLRRLRLHARLTKPRIAEAGEADEHHNPGRSFGDRRSGKREHRNHAGNSAYSFRKSRRILIDGRCRPETGAGRVILTYFRP